MPEQTNSPELLQPSAPSNVGKSRSRGKVALNRSEAKSQRQPAETASLTPTSNSAVKGRKAPAVAKQPARVPKSASIGQRVQATLEQPEKKAEYGPSSAMEELNNYIASQGDEQQHEEVEPAAKVQEAASEFPQYLAEALAERGFSEADFKSPQAAFKFLASTPKPQAPAQAAAPAQQEQKPFDPFEGFDRKAFEAEFGEQGTHLLSLLERAEKRNAQAFNQLAQHAMSAQKALENQHWDRVNRAFESLNSKYGNAFGSGEVNQHSLEFGNRQSIYSLAATMENNLINQGQRVPPLEVLMEKAAAIELSNRKLAAAIPDDEEPQPAPRRQRPRVAGGSASSGEDQLSPRAGGLNAIRQFMRR